MLISRVNTEIQEDSASIQPLYEKDKSIDLYIGHAKFLENKVVEVNNITMTAPNIYIAVGSKPQIPNISWFEGTPSRLFQKTIIKKASKLQTPTLLYL